MCNSPVFEKHFRSKLETTATTFSGLLLRTPPPCNDTPFLIIFGLFAKVNTRGPQNPENDNSVLEKENIIQKFLEIYRSGPKSNNNLWDMVKFEQIRREAAELQK